MFTQTDKVCIDIGQDGQVPVLGYAYSFSNPRDEWFGYVAVGVGAMASQRRYVVKQMHRVEDVWEVIDGTTVEGTDPVNSGIRNNRQSALVTLSKLSLDIFQSNDYIDYGTVMNIPPLG
jgi:hypothetical protein